MNRLTAYAQLVRLPNVFTACADITVGVLAGHVPLIQSLPLIGTSACLYSAGMASNDYFDRYIDAIERPQRPLPRVAISPTAACGLALALVAIGIMLSATVSVNSLLHAAILFVLILTYNAGLKSTVLGPLVMGGCRFVNVLLGFSCVSADAVDWSMRLAIAGIVGTYIVGVTLAARQEAGQSSTGVLGFAGGTSLFAVAAAALVQASSSSLHPYVIAYLILFLVTKAAPAFNEPSPKQVQRFVKAAIFGLVVLDSALATALAGPVGLCVLFWLIPAVILGRWLYST